ncbi:Polyketide cyclase / dehydrase and lipid transport protein [Rhynchospora pubera]|uniref:Polyketide cyclase / dehydrase and lipid transport protein n=1 Tax=Rhynchospora pubera TaxID=906938 RepID=A0AAV8EVD0_9POAL|nr:Polyketide cyclase / dehydrase and lipid transport protein [Rhynchospora pubera]
MLSTAPRIVSSLPSLQLHSLQFHCFSSQLRTCPYHHTICSKPGPHLTHLCHSSSDPVEVPLSETEETDADLKEEREGGFQIEVEKVEGRKNARRIKAQVRIDAQLETVWDVLTDYEGLADFIPGLSESQLLHYEDNFARLYQVGQQELALGFKFSAKGVIECYEKEMEFVSDSCRKRAIEFNMVEGDFKTFEGQWCIELEFGTKLLYSVEVEPKLMVPVQLIEGRLCREVEVNLLSIREEAQRLQKLQNDTLLGQR